MEYSLRNGSNYLGVDVDGRLMYHILLGTVDNNTGKLHFIKGWGFIAISST